MSVYPLKLLTPEKKLFDGMVTAMTVPCKDGQLTVLAGHAPMVALLAEGAITIRTQHETLEGAAGRGVLQIDHKEAAVMVHSFRWAGDEQPEDEAAEDARDAML